MAEHRTQVPWVYRLVAAVLRLLMRLVTRYSVTGLEHVPTSGGFLVTPNHISYLDPFPWAHTLYDEGVAPVFMAKSELFESWWLGPIMRQARQVPVYRERHDAASALRDAVAALEQGRCVAIYPEGTLTRDPDEWPMRGKTGAARLALEAGCPVIPIAQWGPQEILPQYSRIPRLVPRRTTHIRFGPPVDLRDLAERDLTTVVVMEATDRIMAAITHEVEQLRGERAPAVRFDPQAHGIAATGDYRHARGRLDSGGAA